MKTLKESILNRSSHSGESFKAQRREMIETWLKKYNIENYTINKDFTIDVDGAVYLSRRNLIEFPAYIQFRVVKDDFNCSNSKLTSLKGAPKEVGGNFYCFRSNLISLEGAPKKVGRDFYCSFNQLTSLEGAPERVGGDFMCYKNKVQFTRKDIIKICNVKGKTHFN